MSEIYNDGFDKYEGYISSRDEFNGVIFCLHESNVKHEEVNEFWFREIVCNEKKYHNHLSANGACQKDVVRSKKTATKFTKRFTGILSQLNSQLGVKADLKEVAFCNVNPTGGGNTISFESGYKEALKSIHEKLEEIVSSVKSNTVVICTCSDVYENLKEHWGGKEKLNTGIQYSDDKVYPCFQCRMTDKDVYVYKIQHPTYSRKLKGE